MNIPFIIIHTFFWLIIFALIYEKILKLNIFNKKEKCYLTVNVDKLNDIKNKLIDKGEDDSYITFKKRYVVLLYQSFKIHDDDTILIPNSKGRIIEYGIITPLYLIIILIPVIYFLIELRNRMLIVVILSLLIYIYSMFLIYLKYKICNYDEITEDTVYKHNYITYINHYNKGIVIALHFILWAVIFTQSQSSIIMFCLVFAYLHINLFIDKIDQKFNLNLLKKKNMDITNILGYSIVMIIFAISFAHLGLYPLYYTY